MNRTIGTIVLTVTASLFLFAQIGCTQDAQANDASPVPKKQIKTPAGKKAEGVKAVIGTS